MEKKEEKKQEKNIDEIIKHHVYWSVAAGLIPLPVVDIAAVTAIQVDMLKQVCTFYKIDYSEETGKTWISALVTSTMSSVLARIGSSALKFIPVVGTVLGATSMAIVSGASTYALGHAFSHHFANGGDFNNLDGAKVKEFYEEQVKEGKKVAQKLKEQYLELIKTPAGKEKQHQAAKKIKELDELKANKQITEEEYEKLKKEVFKKFLGDE